MCDVATDVETLTSPAGRVTTQKYDPLGHLLEMDVPGVLPVTFLYDDNGRLTTTTQGTRIALQTYGADGWLASITDPLHQTTALTRDAVGRVLTEQRPDLAITSFGYDADGNTTEVVPPGKPAHEFVFDARDELSSYEPPVLASGATPTDYGYNLDRQPLSVTQPGPRQIDYAYDSAGRLTTTTFPTGVITRTYDAAGRIASLAGPTGVTLSYGYDGSLLTTMTWSGAVNGVVARTFDSDFRVASETVNGLFPAAFGYDADSLLTSAGGLTITRDPLNGRVVGTAAGNVGEIRSYDAFGALASTSTSFNGTPLLSFAYVRDELGRIVQKTETEGGVDTVFAYAYDDVGRLTTVLQDGVLVESYAYDANGNRTLSQNSAGTFSATTDAQDRPLTYGSLALTYTPNGELASKTDSLTNETTQYTYDAVGNLREVVLPDGRDVTYLVDGGGRRVAKLVNGVTEQGWLWGGALQPVAELDGSGKITKRFVYSGSKNVPELIVTPTTEYRVVADHLGSVRRVVDVATGVVVQSLEYDAWGRVLVDSKPGFQPFGFAGGFYDSTTALVRFGARTYDPNTGVWLSVDSVALAATGDNRFRYADDDPVNFVDPEGLYVGAIVLTAEEIGITLLALKAAGVFDSPAPAPLPGAPSQLSGGAGGSFGQAFSNASKFFVGPGPGPGGSAAQCGEPYRKRRDCAAELAAADQKCLAAFYRDNNLEQLGLCFRAAEAAYEACKNGEN